MTVEAAGTTEGAALVVPVAVVGAAVVAVLRVAAVVAVAELVLPAGEFVFAAGAIPVAAPGIAACLAFFSGPAFSPPPLGSVAR